MSEKPVTVYSQPSWILLWPRERVAGAMVLERD